VPGTEGGEREGEVDAKRGCVDVGKDCDAKPLSSHAAKGYVMDEVDILT